MNFLKKLICFFKNHPYQVGKGWIKKCLVYDEDIKKIVDKNFYICPNHKKTGGYESCCECEGDRKCSEALDYMELKPYYDIRNKMKNENR